MPHRSLFPPCAMNMKYNLRRAKYQVYYKEKQWDFCGAAHRVSAVSTGGSGMEQCLVLGGGVSGRAAVRLARRIGMEPVMVSDGPEVDAVRTVAGHTLIIASPGVKPLSSPLYRAAMRRAEAGEAELISELEFGYRALPAPRRLLAVTGTNGKTTTTELTCQLLLALGVRAEPAGNIGFPLSDIACDMLEGRLAPETLPVVEVSSFQLERIRDFTPVAAVLLNLESDHIDRYAGGFAEYRLVKFRIFQSVPAENQLFGLSMALPVGRRVTVEGHELLVDGKPLLNLAKTRLNAPHNRENLAAAVELALRILPAERLFTPEFVRAVEAFAPGRHRLETVEFRHGITFIDDSKATNPASVVAALNSLPDPGCANIVILLGGLDKGMDFSSLASWGHRIKFAALFGECRAGIAAAVGEAFPTADCGSDFRLAFDTALKNAVPGDVVLLSPACASMDMFKDYKERGDRFTELARCC